MNAHATTTPNPAAASEIVAASFLVQGRVQGVGFRPAVARVAVELGLSGEVRNTPRGVEIAIEGHEVAVERFERELLSRLPPLARVDAMTRGQRPLLGARGFRIEKGASLKLNSLPVAVLIPADVRACPDCLVEIAEAANRRYGYPLASCVNCGPRYSILESLPYERSATTMARFPLCGGCQREYYEPADRRHHAQTISCDECGPTCHATEGARTGTERPSAATAIAAAAQAIQRGEIVAIKGLGGYQLLVDATNPSAVRRLRARKGRLEKPLAVLADSLAAAETLVELTAAERVALADPAGPIVVATTKENVPLADTIAPGLREIGVMLPTTPLHWLIARDCPPLVATSGNVEGEPLVADELEARERLAHVADHFLHHDRPIRRSIDDSVVRVIADRRVSLRLARGIAPLELRLNRLVDQLAESRHAGRTILALGGHQKSALAIFNGCQAVLGPHVGDLDDLLTRARFVSHARDLCQLLGAKPHVIVHDLHPDYFTTQLASTHWASTGKKGGGWNRGDLLGVQHHHAHVVAGMIEAGWLDRSVLGVAWDGAGYGPDGTIWGGEFLLATSTDYRRVARLRPFPLLGGDSAARQPVRVALAILADAVGIGPAIGFLVERGYDERFLVSLARLLTRPQLAVLTSSAGRLFDGVAAMILPSLPSRPGGLTFEGQAAMLLEATCSPSRSLGLPSRAAASRNQIPLPSTGAARDRSPKLREAARDGSPKLRGPYPFPIVAGSPAELDWRPLIAGIVADWRAGVADGAISRRFHATLADGIARVADQYRSLPVVLGGGVFQNRVLVEGLHRLFARRRQRLGLPGVIPPGDGGLAAGQLAVAMARLARDDVPRDAPKPDAPKPDAPSPSELVFEP